MLFVFDWDGTILDSAGKIVRSMQMAADELELPAISENEVRNIIGLGLPEAVQALFPCITGSRSAALRESYAAHYRSADQVPCQFFPGVEASLDRLKNDGHRLAVATGKSRHGLDRVLENVGMDGYFHATRCADETASKPHPRMLLELMKELDAEPEATVMIGDTEFDMEMAVNAGVRRVGVRYGVHDADRLQRHDLDLLIDSFNELLEWPVRQRYLSDG